MNFHLDLSKYKYLFSFIAIILISIDSGNSRRSRYVLPVLPGTHYTLNDVIILPDNSDVIQITIASISTSEELASLNLTVEQEFRLGNAVAVQNLSVESGLRLITTYKTNVVLDLPGGLLKLPSISDYGKLYHVLTLTDNAERDLDKILVIQSEVPNTSMKVCGINNTDELMNRNQNLKETSKGDIKIDNCSTLITSRTGRYLSNDTLGFQITTITSEHPIGFLQGRVISSLNSNKNKQNTSYPLSSRINWQALSALIKSTNIIIVVPNRYRREYTFWIASPNNCVVVFQTNNSSTTINLTSHKPFHKNVIIPAGNILTVTGNDEYSLHCVKSDNSTCNAELFSIPKESIIYNSSSYTNSMNNAYMWLYISNNTTPFILVLHSTDLSIMYSNGKIAKEEITDFDICNSSLTLKSFAKFQEGLYKLSVNQNIYFDLFFYLPKLNICKCDETKRLKPAQFTTKLSSIIPKKLSDTSTVSLFSSFNITSDKPSKLQAGKTTTPNSIVKETDRTKNTKFLPVSVDFSNSTVEAAKSTFDENTVSLIQYEQTTHTSNDFSNKIQKSYIKENRQTDDSDPNRMFKAIVDIVHSAEGRKDILLDKPNSKVDSKYTYTYNVNDYYGPEHRGKNPVAIIASLISAILAVGAIILIFLLKDFFSHRQNIRNTRIQPFISHY